MATIKALEGRTVHQIQSGQVIVDLCSVVKELVENSLDAGATSIEVRFKNNGLDSIEVQDNGSGISKENYETIALKHFTSKLDNYDDLHSLQTFGFRGEALSSLCALSNFHMTTARADEAPKGTRLDFEFSGKLQKTQVIASQRGTTVIVEDLFKSLPVRRRELEKNIKREYGKVLGILQAYSCISTQARLSVSNMMAKSKKAIVFATKSNQSTRDNIANVFGAKALSGLVAMDLGFDMETTDNLNSDHASENKRIQILGHVSRPTLGEGRQAPDRQLFFVNARPCALPQVAKVFNEVYKSYNVSQSPFVFANIILDTNTYDVNVSPDKRTILLHDQGALLESLRGSLTALFEEQDQTVPQSLNRAINLFSSNQPAVCREKTTIEDAPSPVVSTLTETAGGNDGETSEEENTSSASDSAAQASYSSRLIGRFAGRDARQRISEPALRSENRGQQQVPDAIDNTRSLANPVYITTGAFESGNDFNPRTAEQQVNSFQKASEADIASEDSSENSDPDHIVLNPQTQPSSGVVQNAFDRMRPRRRSPEVATITIGSKTSTSVLGPLVFKRREADTASPAPVEAHQQHQNHAETQFSSSMKAFAAPGSQLRKTVGKMRSKSHTFRQNVKDTSDAEEPTGDSSLVSVASEESNERQEQDSQYTTNESSPGDLGSLEGSAPIESDSDGGFVDEVRKKAREEAKVAELIKQAEETEAIPSHESQKRAKQILKGGGRKDFTTDLVQIIDACVERICQQLRTLESSLREPSLDDTATPMPTALAGEIMTPEDRLTLTISKGDFSRMHVIGQFNLGFILATRNNTDLFIIDQHASDEKYNFERLQSTTIVQNQRLVHPYRLELTAVDEEIMLENHDTLLANGFSVEIDTSGDVPVGQRCKILSLPMSREVTFDTSDLEELVALLADSPPSTTTSSTHIARPSKVRRMFAMRACRSSVMVGKTLTMKQMGALVKRMGEIDKPWNCPHGRPTVRHVCRLEGLSQWTEGDGLGGMEEEKGSTGWAAWIEGVREQQEPEIKSEEAEDQDRIRTKGREDESEPGEAMSVEANMDV